MIGYIKNAYNNIFQAGNDYVKEVETTPPKNKLCAITYSNTFIDINENTEMCEFKDNTLTCDKDIQCELTNEFLQLDEVKINKHIYFHDKYCNVKTYVNNKHSNGGEVYINLSYLE